MELFPKKGRHTVVGAGDAVSWLGAADGSWMTEAGCKSIHPYSGADQPTSSVRVSMRPCHAEQPHGVTRGLPHRQPHNQILSTDLVLMSGASDNYLARARCLGTRLNMRPNQIEHIYQQYKHDTRAVALWLASTAQICGYPEGLLASKSWDIVQSKIGHLTDKKRRRARHEENPLQRISKEEEYIVALNDLLPLARFIAQRTNTAVSVPEVFSETLDRLISLRTRFSQIKMSTNASSDPISDRNHGYFINILKDVRSTLRPVQKLRTRTQFPRLSRRLLMRIF